MPEYDARTLDEKLSFYRPENAIQPKQFKMHLILAISKRHKREYLCMGLNVSAANARVPFTESHFAAAFVLAIVHHTHTHKPHTPKTTNISDTLFDVAKPLCIFNFKKKTKIKQIKHITSKTTATDSLHLFQWATKWAGVCIKLQRALLNWLGSICKYHFETFRENSTFIAAYTKAT